MSSLTCSQQTRLFYIYLCSVRSNTQVATRCNLGRNNNNMKLRKKCLFFFFNFHRSKVDFVWPLVFTKVPAPLTFYAYNSFLEAYHLLARTDVFFGIGFSWVRNPSYNTINLQIWLLKRFVMPIHEFGDIKYVFALRTYNILFITLLKRNSSKNCDTFSFEQVSQFFTFFYLTVDFSRIWFNSN